MPLRTRVRRPSSISRSFHNFGTVFSFHPSKRSNLSVTIPISCSVLCGSFSSSTVRTMPSQPCPDSRSDGLYNNANCQNCQRAFSDGHKTVQLPSRHLTGRTISPGYVAGAYVQGHETCPVCGNGISELRRSFITANSHALYRASHSTTRISTHRFSHRSHRPASLTPGPRIMPPLGEYSRGSKLLVPTPCHSSPRLNHLGSSPVHREATRDGDHPASLKPAHGNTSSHHSRLYSSNLRNS